MLTGKCAFITGTGRGIGRALVEAFARSGADVIAHARRPDEAHLRSLAETAQRYSVRIDPVFFDMTDTAAMRSELKELLLSRRNIDVLVNCAGVGHGVSFQRTPVSRIREVFEVNLFAQMELTQLVLKAMVRRRSGVIVNMGSVSGLDLPAGNCAYGTAKAALAAFTKTLACEVGAFGIRVNCVAPGLTDTDMGHSVRDFAAEEMLKDCVAGRAARPEEIADVVVFLASDEASFVNGQTIRVDGGKHR